MMSRPFGFSPSTDCRGFLMKLLPLRAAIASSFLFVAVVVSAKPLVVCTEASPEGFDMVQYTTAVTADAVAETIFNRLADFKPGTTEVVPALADSWDISEDGLDRKSVV